MMEWKFEKLAREELYELVWSEPMVKAAQRYRMSDVNLKKICRKHGIPVPGRGYWRRRETGRNAPRVPLPKSGDARPIQIRVREKTQEDAMEEFEAVKAQKAFEESDEHRIIVPETLVRPHPITAETRKVLQAAKPDDYGMLKCTARELFHLRVGPNSVNRALRILDALLKAFNERGFKVVCGVHEREHTRVMVNGEDISFSIEETAQRQAHRLTEDEKKRQREGTLYYVHTYDYVPSGALTLKLDTPYSSGIPGTFTDRARLSLEQKLNEMMVSMVHVAEWRKEERRKQEKKERRLAAENTRREELRRRHQEEASRVKKLQKDADAWNAAEALRRYIAAVEAQAKQSGAEMPIEDLPNWLRWAREQADRIDPLKKSPPSILDEKPPELLSIWQIE